MLLDKGFAASMTKPDGRDGKELGT